MAEELQIGQTGSTAKVRNPWGVLGLSLVTIGIYFFFWWYFINREMRDLGRARNADLGQKPTNSVLAMTLGALVIVPVIVTEWTSCGRLEASQQVVGMENRVSGPVAFILLLLVSPVGIWYIQHELNKVWEAQGTAPSALPGDQASEPEATPPPPAEPAPVDRQAE